MKKAVLIIIFMCVLSLPVSASGDTYKETYDSLGAERLQEALEGPVREFLDKNGITPEDSNWVNNIGFGNGRYKKAHAGMRVHNRHRTYNRSVYKLRYAKARL